MNLSRDDREAARQLAEEFESRKRQRGPRLATLERVNLHYNGEYSVPLPELDEEERPAIANMIYIGIETHATRIASVQANIKFASLHPGYNAPDERARDRRKAVAGWWKMNNMPMKDRRRARHLTAYGTSPVSISPVSLDPHDKRSIPFWRVRNPLSTYPSPSLDPDDMEPVDCIFVDYKPLAWLRANYPRQAAVLSTGNDWDTDLFTVLEYVDAAETVYVVLGKERTKRKAWEKPVPASMQEVLGRVENHAGVCPVVNPGRISLTHVMGQFDQLFGTYQRAAKLDALNTIAVFRDVFPDQWAVSPANAASRPKIVTEADGKSGIIGEIENGTIISLRSSPGPATSLAQDNMERTQRLMGLLPEQIGGEGAVNVRTARQGTELLSSAIDMPIQEAQEILATSKELEISRAVAYMKAYYGPKPSMFFFGRNAEVRGSGDYVPNETFETGICEVTYPMPGTDINGLILSIGQRLGLGIMSVMTAMVLDPTIEDAEEEYARVQVDQIRKAMLSGLEQRLAAGTMDPVAGARLITTMLSERIPIENALVELDKVLQQEQADQANQQQQALPPGQAPEAQPEAQPGVEANQGNGPVAPAPTATPSLEDLLSNLHVPQNLQGNAPTPRANVGVQ